MTRKRTDIARQGGGRQRAFFARATASLVTAALLWAAPARGSADSEAPPEKASPAAAAGKRLPLEAYYDRGMVLSTPDGAKVVFKLQLNHVSQFKYTNTLAVDKTFTDQLGREYEVLRRNDVQLTRDVFYFSGYVLTPKLDFAILIYTSTATLSATPAGYVGYAFNKMFALRLGFFSLPSVRSLTGTYPFFHGTDRSMANNYVRPGFTQGIWAEGELFPGFSYIAMLGNALNTFEIPASLIDNTFAWAASVCYDWNDFGKPWNDQEYHEAPALRIGTAFTFAPEDRLSDLSKETPENNSIFISSGLPLFQTGALAPGVTISLANYYLWAIDAGLKYRGLAFNTEFYQRWLNKFEADGPLPMTSMHDWGFEASVGYFLLRGVLEPYARTSFIHGPFATPVEGGGGLNWYPFRNRILWVNVEGIGIKHSPFGSTLYPYAPGQTGFLFQSQFVLRF
jgi:hypothetical protein